MKKSKLEIVLYFWIFTSFLLVYTLSIAPGSKLRNYARNTTNCWNFFSYILLHFSLLACLLAYLLACSLASLLACCSLANLRQLFIMKIVL